ncbi:MAG: hypothetical protein AAFW98_03275, partial [Pseudomonadota bacterium]
MSARDSEALRARVVDLLAWLHRDGATAPLSAIAATLQRGRETMADRLALLVKSRAELSAGLSAFLAGTPSAQVMSPTPIALPEPPEERRKLAAAL